MKAPLLLALFAASMLLSACETRVASRRPVYRRTVYATAPSNRVIYRDSRHHRTYHDDRVIYRTHGPTNRDFPARSVDRSYAF